MPVHHYETRLKWTGNSGLGTRDYKSYGRDYELTGSHKIADIPSSADPHFRGDAGRYNPEELLVAALSGCHLLAYLHLCAVNGIVVTAYEDHAGGEMKQNPDGSGDFTEVTLRPQVTITEESDAALALELHHKASTLCFIARSVKFPVHHQPSIRNG